MTLSVTQNGALRSVGRRLATIGTETLYTALADTRPTIASIHLANVTSAPVSVTLQWYDASGPKTYALLSGHALAANAFLTLPDFDLALFDGDKLQASANVANAVDIVVTLMERAGRVS